MTRDDFEIRMAKLCKCLHSFWANIFVALHFIFCHDFYFCKYWQDFYLNFYCQLLPISWLPSSPCLPSLSFACSFAHIFVKSANVAIVYWLLPATSCVAASLWYFLCSAAFPVDFVAARSATNMKANLHNNFCQIFVSFGIFCWNWSWNCLVLLDFVWLWLIDTAIGLIIN